MAITVFLFERFNRFLGGQPSTSLDGISLVSLLRPQGNVTKTPVHDVIFYYCSDYLMAVRIGSYKVRISKSLCQTYVILFNMKTKCPALNLSSKMLSYVFDAVFSAVGQEVTPVASLRMLTPG